jgi:pyruvate formate lyase activating enzyme
MPVSEILSAVERDRPFFGNAGGVTLSGGEPFLQGEGTLSLLRAFREAGISTAVETCGYADPDVLLRACPLTDLFLWDLKDTDEERHRQYTGVSNERILKNLHAVANTGANIRLRCILVHGVNANTEHYEQVARIAKEIPHLQGVDVLPYHAYGGSKATLLGKSDNGRVDWIPTESEIQEFRTVLHRAGWNG